MAIIDSKITNIGKKITTQLLTGTQSSGFMGIGVGNQSTASSENDTGLCGGETKFKAGNNSYFESANNSWIAQWNSSWVYDDLATNKYGEIVVTTNGSTGNNTLLLRATYDTVTIGSGDSLAITAQISVDEGS